MNNLVKLFSLLVLISTFGNVYAFQLVIPEVPGGWVQRGLYSAQQTNGEIYLAYNPKNNLFIAITRYPGKGLNSTNKSEIIELAKKSAEESKGRQDNSSYVGPSYKKINGVDTWQSQIEGNATGGERNRLTNLQTFLQTEQEAVKVSVFGQSKEYSSSKSEIDSALNVLVKIIGRDRLAGVEISPAVKIEPAILQPSSTSGLDDAKSKCKELGFKEQTEGFGKCVLRLSK